TGTVTASASLTGLSAGSYSATVTVTATGATTKTIPVTLNVASSTSTTSTGYNQATLSWNANTEPDLAGYKVYQKTSLTGAYTSPIITIPKGTTTYTVTGLTAPTTYYFVIKAYDTAGNESPFSPEVSKSVY
ncbi:MAG: fibronectin type III domain-containing protein, partial [Nitrospiraceae bacterium]